jgi:hypothetical protein
MTHKQSAPPRTQRVFVNCWGELEYLCRKMRYWLYTKKQKPRAERYLSRLTKVLRKLPTTDSAIIQEEGLALFHELKGDLTNAIAHREREIQLMELLHHDAQSTRYAETTKAYMLRDRDVVDLQNRQAILQALKKELTRNHTPKLTKKHRSIDDSW